jgi:methicillin resistance protein
VKHFFLGRANNFNVKETLRFLASFGTKKDYIKLKHFFAEHYQVDQKNVYLFHSGRTALSLALLSQIPAISNSSSVVEKTKTLVASKKESLPAVAITSLTCFAVVQAIRTAGYQPIYLDIDPKTLHFDANTLKRCIKKYPNLKAVVVQNNLGIPVDIAEIEKLAKAHKLFLIEDLAHSYDIHYPDGRLAGSVGDAIVLSFGKGKSLDTISGGALIMRTDSKNQLLASQNIASRAPKISDSLRDNFYPLFALISRALSYFSFGRFNIGQIWILTLLKLSFIQRSADAELDFECRLSFWQSRYLLKKLQKNQNYHSILRYPLLLKDRNNVLAKLKRAGFFFDDIWYDSPVAPKRYFSESNFNEDDCPIATLVAKHLINLPTNYSFLQLKKAWQIIAPQLVEVKVDRQGQPELLRKDPVALVKGQKVSRSLNKLSSQDWQAQIQNYELANFLQSPRWQKYNEILGHRVILREFYGHIKVLMIIKDAKRGRFLEISNGPLLDWQDSVLVALAFQEIFQIAKQYKCVFIRFRPALADSEENRFILKQLGSIEASFHLHAEHTVMIDLTKTEEELLSTFRRQTRYEVRRAVKLKITVEDRSDDDSILDEFHQVQLDTAKRQNFIPPTKKELQALKDSFAEDLRLYVAYDETHRPIAYGLILIDGIEADYYEAASTPLNRKLPGAYALQWQIMRDLKKRGIKRYNLWGIAPEGQSKHRYAGVTTFKTGFSEHRFTYVAAQDIPVSPLRYQLNRLVETIRKKRRHL